MNATLTLSGLWILSMLLAPPVSADTPDTAPRDVPRLTFSAALQLAQQTAPILQARAATVRAADFALQPAAALPDPQLVLGASNVPATGPDRGRLDQDFMTMQRIGIMQDVPSRAKRRARVAVARAQVSEAEAKLALERAVVLRDTAQAWLDEYYLERRLPLFDELEHELALLAQVTQAQLAAGTGSAVAALGPMEQSAALADLRNDTDQKLAAARARLQRMIGDDAFMPLASNAPPLVIEPSQLREHLHHHPELALYDPLTDLAQARVQKAEADKQSDWSLGFDYQHREKPYDDMVSMEVRFDLPLFPGARQSPRIAAARQRLNALHSEREAMLRDHDAALAADLATHQSLIQQINRIGTTWLPLAEQTLSLTMAGYRAGQQELTQTLAARRSLIELRLREIELQHQRAILAAKLIYAYGAPQQ